MGSSDGTIVGTTKVIDHGPSNERWDLVMLGDGFRAADQASYQAAVATFVTTLQATAPFDKAWDRINVHRIDVHSTEAGADEPATCGDGSTAAASTVKTYFDASFCGDGATRRLLTCDAPAVITAVNARVPNWDAILVIVNTTIYGGSGGWIGVYSLAPTAHEIGLHEMGHAAFDLADEYDNRGGCTSGETGQDHHDAIEPNRPNVTLETDRAKIKWRHLIAPGTNVPTLPRIVDCTKCDTRPSPVPAGTVGLFEGAHYTHCGAFRPAFDCRMRTLGQSFCTVCQEQIRAKLGAASKSTCFVATAVYGDADHPDVATLRGWRDRHLARGNVAMRVLSAAYRRAGPPLAAGVTDHPRLRGSLRHTAFAPLARLLRRRGRG